MRINLIKQNYSQQNFKNRPPYKSALTKSSVISPNSKRDVVKTTITEAKTSMDEFITGFSKKLKHNSIGTEFMDTDADSPEAEISDSIYNSNIVEESGIDGKVHVTLEKSIAEDRNKEVRSDSTLKMYFKQIKDIPILSAEEEYKIAKKAYEGKDEKARQTLINSNLRFVVSVAKKYMNKGMPLIDLIQEGNLGLIKAAETFDYTKEVKFITYAVWHIEKEIKIAIAEKARTIGLPNYIRSLLYKIKKTTAKLTAELGRSPTIDELADKTGIPEAKLISVLKSSKPVKSLDEPLDTDSSRKFIDIIPSDSGTLSKDILESQEENAIYARNLLSKLSPMERKVLALKFGINSEFPKSTEEIASIYGISRTKAMHIERRAMKKLKQIVQK